MKSRLRCPGNLVIGTAPDVDAARRLGDEQAADPDYPWYRISRAGEHVETTQSFPTEYYDPERDAVPPPVPSPEDRASWPRPGRPGALRTSPRTHGGGAPAPVVALPEGGLPG